MKTTTNTLFFYLLALCTSIVAGDELAKFETGVNSLCIGHSFFFLIYEEMNTYVDLKTYPDHGFNEVFRGGEDGSPQSLWANDKRTIESYLETGNIDLFMMTVHLDTVVEDYVKWIDLARSYNPNTAILIGIPWAADGPLKATSVYNAEIESLEEPTFAIVEELRNLYQGTPVYYLNYGHAAARMRVLFDQGALEDIQNLCCTTEDSIYRDQIPGHQGEMLRDIAALFWIKFLYGDTSVTLPHYNTDDVDDIIAYTQTKNIGKNNQTVISENVSTSENVSKDKKKGKNILNNGKYIFMHTVKNVYARITIILVFVFLSLLFLKWKFFTK